MSETPSCWMVTDLSQPDDPLGPQFGPFPDRASAEEFAEMRDSYWAHDTQGQ